MMYRAIDQTSRDDVLDAAGQTLQTDEGVETPQDGW